MSCKTAGLKLRAKRLLNSREVRGEGEGEEVTYACKFHRPGLLPLDLQSDEGSATIELLLTHSSLFVPLNLPRHLQIR